MPQSYMSTTVVNTSGSRQYFDFLPPHGTYLEADQEFTWTGSVYDWLVRQGGQPRTKLQQCLEYCLENGLIEIKDQPAVILYDGTNTESKEVVLDGGTLGVADPAYVS